MTQSVRYRLHHEGRFKGPQSGVGMWPTVFIWMRANSRLVRSKEEDMINIKTSKPFKEKFKYRH